MRRAAQVLQRSARLSFCRAFVDSAQNDPGEEKDECPRCASERSRAFAGCRSWSRNRAGLAHQAHHHRLGAGRRRRERHHRPHGLRAAAGSAGPAGPDRKPARRQRQCRRGSRRARCARRLHADDRHRRDDDVERASVQKHAVRSGEGLRADHQRRRQHHRAGGACRPAGEVGGGAGRPRQGQSRQAAVRLLGCRVAASSRRRTAEAQDRHRHRARALSRRQPVGERPGRRPYRRCVSQLLVGGAGAADRQDQDSRRGREGSLRGDPGRADGRGNRSGIRDDVMARLFRAGRNAAPDRCAAERRTGENPQCRHGEGAAWVTSGFRSRPARRKLSPRPCATASRCAAI